MSRLLGLAQRSTDVYPLLDWRLAVQIGGLLWLIGAGAAAAVLPFAHPTHGLGEAGWPIVIGISVSAAITGVFLVVRPATISPVQLLLMGYLAAAGLGVGQALIGPEAQFEMSFLLLAAYHASVHPARRVLPLLGWVVVCETVSTLVADPAAVHVAQMSAAVVLICMMTLIALVHARSNRALARELMRGRADAEHRARTDSLTGLGNRRAFDEALARHVSSSQRYGRPLSIAMLDIDDFKSINDRFGHDAGDDTLVAVADAITTEIRLTDRAFRWGGDEFAVLLPETQPAAAARAGERIAAAVLRDARLPDHGPVSIGSGVATLDRAEPGTELVERADARLLVAKRRNSSSGRGGRALSEAVLAADVTRPA